jgi:predicted transcriptional regulator
MTKMLEEAIAKVRELPAEDQDAFAAAILSMADEEMPVGQLDEDTRAAIREGLAQARRGECATDDEMDALWKHHGI